MRQDETLPTLDDLTADHDSRPDLVHADLGVTPSNCPLCHEEPHHAAARHRTDEEQAALTDYVTGDELRALRRCSGVDRPTIRTVDPGGVL